MGLEHEFGVLKSLSIFVAFFNVKLMAVIKSIAKALDILELLSLNENRETGLSEIASRLNMDKGTCANIIKTLRLRGYIEQPEPRQDYRIGYKLYHLTGRSIENDYLTKTARRDIDILGTSLNETAILSVIRNDHRIVLYGTVPERGIVAKTRLDKSVYAACTGRAILANYSPTHLDKFINRMGVPLPEEWPEISKSSNPEGELRNALVEIKRAGYAIDHDANGVVGFATPLFKDNHVVGAVGVYMPALRLTNETDILNSVLKCAECINKKLEKKV